MRFLTLDEILEINETIYQKSLEDKTVEYSGRTDYTINRHKIEQLIKSVPSTDLVEVATYYLKNLILLQAFPNANHRTAIIAVELFLKYNGHQLRYRNDALLKFHKRSFSFQSKVYGTLEERDTRILKEAPNEFYEYCKKFIEDNLS